MVRSERQTRSGDSQAGMAHFQASNRLAGSVQDVKVARFLKCGIDLQAFTAATASTPSLLHLEGAGLGQLSPLWVVNCPVELTAIVPGVMKV